MTLDVAHLPANVECLRPLLDAGILGATEIHVASFILDAAPVADDHVAWGIAAATWAVRHGHDCADVRRLPDVVTADQTRRLVDSDAVPVAVDWPDADRWIAALQSAARQENSPVRIADGADEDPDEHLDDRPLVVCGDRLYLQRYWIDECVVTRGIAVRASTEPLAVGQEVEAMLDVLLPMHPTGRASGAVDSVNAQRVAADTMLRHRISVIAGGPGTGKTYSVARVLAALHREGGSDGGPLRVGLAAPTGKAAQRLKETILGAVADMRDTVPIDTITALESIVPTTIHRLLGALGATGRFRHTASSPLDLDIVIVDETSMVSLPLAARLVDALRPDTRLVLVGDPDQLVSVEVGSVLADLVAAADGVLADRVVHLTESHRFTGQSPIAVLARAVLDRDEEAVRAFVRDPSAHDLVETHATSTVHFHETPTADTDAAVVKVEAMVGPPSRRMREAAEAGDVERALAELASARILCAHRRGPTGVSRWNALAEEWMRGPQTGRGTWYAGRPVLVTRNDPRLGLANGDTGVVVRRGDDLQVAFPRGTGEEPLLLPHIVLSDVETCFAMTVHKSQGSEYPSVALVLPPENSPLIGRELAYTGITRARNHVLIVGSEDVLAQCAATPADRMTGLAEALGAR